MIKKLEAILFCASEPMSLDELSSVLNCSEEEVVRGLVELNDVLEQRDSALIVREVATGWALYTKPELNDTIEAFMAETEKKSLSPSSVETLAIIAYMQPVTRARVSDIRGANSDAIISSLIKKGYVSEVGVDKDNSNATLFGTTSAFLEKYGLKSIDELPDLVEFAPDENTRLAIVERLSQSFVADSEI